jgi:hypothetical protein
MGHFVCAHKNVEKIVALKNLPGYLPPGSRKGAVERQKGDSLLRKIGIGAVGNHYKQKYKAIFV